MKIVLENELEKWTWGIMMEAHYKWEKNHGAMLLDQMNCFFEVFFKDERRKIIQKEVERRLRENWGDDYGLTEEEYVAKELADLEDLNEGEKKAWEIDFKEDYKCMQESIEEDREVLKVTVEDQLRSVYYTFFSAPEELSVIYNDEAIQKSH